MNKEEILNKQSANTELIKFLSDKIHFEYDFNEQQNKSWLEFYKDGNTILRVDDNMPLELFKEFIIDAISEDIAMSKEYYEPHWYEVISWVELSSLFMPIVEKFS